MTPMKFSNVLHRDTSGRSFRKTAYPIETNRELNPQFHLRCRSWHVRFGSKADMCGALTHVRFTPRADICGALTITRRKRLSYRELSPYKRHELLTGEILYASGYDGYGDGSGTDLIDFISDEMRADWAENREELLKFWASGEPSTSQIFSNSKPWLFVCGSADTLPWAEHQFGGCISRLGRAAKFNPTHEKKRERLKGARP